MMLNPAAVIVTFTAPVAPTGGATQVTTESLTTVAVDLRSPKSQLSAKFATPLAVAKFCPLIVTVVPPPTAHDVGLNRWMLTVGVYVYTSWFAVQSTPLSVATTPTCPTLAAAGASHEMLVSEMNAACTNDSPNRQAKVLLS